VKGARLAIVGVLASTFACRAHRTVFGDLKRSADAKSAIVSFESSSLVSYAVLDLVSATTTTIAFDQKYNEDIATRIRVFFYPQSTDELLLEPYNVASASGGTRTPPPTDDEWEAAAEGGNATPFARVTPFDPGALMLPVPDIALCTRKGRCVKPVHTSTAGDWPNEALCLPCTSTTGPPIPPLQPALPMPPVLTPCRMGWQATTSSTCEPQAAPPLVSCDMIDGLPAWQPYDAASCISFEEAGCPSLGSFGSVPPNLSVVYVRSGASGDGSMSSPFGTIAEAIATSAQAIAVSDGVYPETFYVGSHAIYGACAGRTIITGPVSSVSAASELHHLSIRGGAWILVRDATSLLDHVTIEGAVHNAALLVQGATVTANALLIRHTSTPDGTGFGAYVDNGGSFVATDAVFEDNTFAGVAAGSASLGLNRVVVRGTRLTPPMPCSPGFCVVAKGIDISVGASLTAMHTDIADNLHQGLIVNGPGSRATLRDVRIREPSPPTIANTPMYGLYVGDGAALDAAGLSIIGLAEHGVTITDQATTASISDALVRGTLTSSRTDTGFAVVVNRSSVRLGRAFLDGNEGGGLYLTRADTDLHDIVIDSRTASYDPLGPPPLFQFTARTTATRLIARNALGNKAFTVALGSTMSLTDARFDNTTGIEVVSSTFTATRLSLERTLALDRGALALMASQSSLTDLGISASTATACRFGVAVIGGSAEIRRMSARKNLTTEIKVIDGGRMSVADLSIAGPIACRVSHPQPAIELCDGAWVELERAMITGAQADALRIENAQAQVGDLAIVDGVSGVRFTTTPCLGGSAANPFATVSRFLFDSVQNDPASVDMAQGSNTLSLRDGEIRVPKGTRAYPRSLLGSLIEFYNVGLTSN
jgi:hypothetical protein